MIIPTVAFVLILSNAFFGHLLYDSPYNQDINKYSVYVHLQPEWESYPGNILYDITTVWSNPVPKENSESFYYDPSADPSLVTSYNYNELEYQNQKPFVQLNHEFSNCESSWKPILHRHAIDTIRKNIQYIQGTQLNTDPYVSIFANIKNEKYDDQEQKLLTSTGFAKFIPICTSKQTTSYQYSLSVNDKNTGFDVYFIPSFKEFEKFLDGRSFEHYQKDGCYATNFQSFTGKCENVDKNSGILIIIPDNLSKSLTKISVSLHENA